MATQSRNLVARIDGDVSGFEKASKSAVQSAKVFERELKKLEQRQIQSVAHVTQMRSRYEAQAARQEAEAARAMERAAAKRNQAMQQVGQASMAMGAAMAAGVALSVRAAVQWESAWAGVTKTVDGNAKQMAVLEGELRQLAKTLPASHREIAAVAEAAGQLGIERDAVAGFTKVMVDLGETTNLTADQAATAMAQIANIMGTAPEDVDRMGAALVALGNAGASTEADIVEMALRIAGAGRQLNLAESDVFAIANALASVGINAEAGGSAISRFLMDIGVAVETGSSKVKGFADVAGMSVDEFSTLFREDAVSAVSAFTDGLGRIQESGGSAIVTLESMEITEIRMRDALLRLAGAQGLLSSSVDLGREAWAANSALVEEANKRYETSAAKMQVARNTVNDLAIDLGSTLLPALAGVAGAVADFAGWIADLPDPVKSAAAMLGTLAAAAALAGGAALIAVPKVVALKVALADLDGGTGRATGKLLDFGKAAGLVGVALTAASISGDIFRRWVGDVSAEGAAAATTLLQIGQSGRLTGDDMAALGGQAYELKDAFDAAFDRNAREQVAGFFTTVGSLGGVLPWGDDDVDAAGRVFKSIDEGLMTLMSSGRMEDAATAFAVIKAQADAQGVSVEQLAEVFPEYTQAVGTATTEQDRALESTRALASEVSGIAEGYTNAYSSLGAWAEAMGYSEEATKDLTKQVEEWASSLADFINPLGAYTDLLGEKQAAERESAEATAAATESQTDSWEDYADAVSVSVGEYLERLREQVEAQEQWHDNMTTLAGRVSQTTLDELARMGPEGAPLVAELVNASGEQLAELEDLFGRRTKGATGAMAAELFLAQPLLATIGAKLGSGVVESLTSQLAAGTTTVAQIANDYAGVLGAGINPLLTALGKASIARRDAAQTRRPQGFAMGDVLNGHEPQMAPGGAWRVWAEDETQGESYIPHANDHRRGRAKDIWRKTGEILGVEFQEFAAGGFTTAGSVPRPPSTSPFRAPISTAADATMAHAYGEATDWVSKNAAPPLSSGIGFQAMMAALHVRFPGLALISGMRPGAITATGNPSYHGMGRAVDLPPRLDVNQWIAQHYAAQTRELILSLPGAVNLHNGKPHRYGEPTLSMHRDHNHWAMAKGGILNPHVRDRGGPLLPGLTLNATGRPEMVLPMADGGMTWSGPTTGGTGSLSQVAAGLSGVDALQALLEGWDRHLDQLAEAARRNELLAGIEQARAEAATADAADQAAAQAKVNEAIAALYEFDVAAYRDAERAAVEAQIESLEALAKAEEEAARAAEEDYRRRVNINNNLYDLGQLTTEQHLSNLNRRMAREEKYGDAWMSLYRQRQQVLKDLADAEKQAADDAAEAMRKRQDAADDALSNLNRLLDERVAIQAKIAQSGLEAKKATEQLREREAENQARHFAGLTAAQEQFADAEARLLDERRRALESFTSIDQLTDFRRGLPTGWLASNVEQQVADLREWMRQLDLARELGVSDSVIEALGLDDGPQALFQVKALTSSTAEEIDRLNRAVEDKTRVAGDRARTEQTRGLGELGRGLLAARQEYDAAVLALQEDYRDEQEQIAQELSEVQRLFVEEQVALADELQAIGLEQGRSLSTAIAEGIRSGIPAIEAAAKAAREAAAGVATGSPAPGRAPSTPSRPGLSDAGNRWLDARPQIGAYMPLLPPVASTSRTVTFNNTFQVKDPVDHELVLRQQAFQANAGAV